MVTPAKRFQGWIETLTEEWRDRLKGWLVTVLSFGLEVFMDIIGKAAKPIVSPFIERLEAIGPVPPELQPILDELKNPKGEFAAMLANSAGSALIGGALGKLVDAVMLPFAYNLNMVTRNVILSDVQYIGLWLRGEMTDAELTEHLEWLGLTPEDEPRLKSLSQIRLDPGSVITAWRRDPAKYEKYFDDLRHQGWTQDRIDTLKFITLFIPSAADIVSWYAKEVYEPEMITRYGLDSELPVYEQTDFPKIGVDAEQARNYWRAHWVHASWTQVVEMLHRGQITEEQVWDWFRLVEIPPFWRDKLIAIAWNVPTRVDVRRFWDMRTIDEARLREVYQHQGYHGKDLDDYVLWTKVYVAFPDLIARFKNGWITEDDVRAQLTGLGMPADRVDEMIQTKIKPDKPERVTGERDLTKTDIYKGVKKGIITWSEGEALLQRLGYDKDEATYILRINVEALAGSPETYSEFLREVELYNKAQGLPAKIPSEDLIQAERNLVEAKKDLDFALEKKLSETELTPLRKAVSNSEYLYRQLLIQYKEQILP